MVFFILCMWMFLPATERPMRMLENPPPPSRDCGAVRQAVEEGRDVHAGVLRFYLFM